jgi:DNA (cytosine-5)-methyltransferase 1
MVTNGGTSMHTQHTYTKVTEQRGVKRLWLQGLRLEACGFEKGARYRVDLDADSGDLYLVLDPFGPRAVSGKQRGERCEPIVDLCNADVVRLVGEATRVRVDFSSGRLRFSVSHLDKKLSEREARFRREVAEGRLSEGTLCAGIGMATAALHEGLAASGVQSSVSWIVDRERRYLQVGLDNNPAVTERTTLFEATLEELEPQLLSPVSIMQASLPCTGHSPAGKAKNSISNAEEHRTDATAVFGFMRVVEATMPSVIVSENVIPARNSATYALIRAMLEALDYRLHEIELGPEQSGAVESRKRWWLVAISKGLPQIDLSTIPVFERRYPNLAALLEPVREDDARWSENQYLKDKQLRDRDAGKGFAQRQLVTAKSERIGTAGRGYSKRRSTEPMLVRADGKERLLTPMELARAHGAPECLIENTSDQVAYEGLGQGIDYLQAVGIGRVIARDCIARANETGHDGPDAVSAVASAPIRSAPSAEHPQFGLFG